MPITMATSLPILAVITALHLIAFLFDVGTERHRSFVLSHSLPDRALAVDDHLQLPFPALYVFGGSTVEAGNNNFLNTIVKLNYPPYGVDFEGGKATGRATNGKTVVDIIAQQANLPFPPPVMALIKGRMKIPFTGVNYASGSSGILPLHPTLKPIFNQVLSMDEQIKYFRNTTKSLKGQFDSLESFASHMSKSLFFIHTGTNDLGIYWEKGYHKDFKEIFEDYALFLSKELYKQLKEIYKVGARNFLLNNVSPLGCLPSKRLNSSCLEEVNERVILFNGLLPDILKKLDKSLKGSKFELFDLYRLFEDVYFQPETYGFTNVNSSCCIDGAGNQTRECLRGSIPCADRSSYVFFDPFHPTESIHKLWAGRVFNMLSL